MIAELFWYGVPFTAHTNTLIRSSIEYGVPQGSVIGPLLFNIDLIDLIYECDDWNIVNYANNTSPYACRENILAAIS